MTSFYGIIGNPVSHSLSPQIHNKWFEQNKIDAKYQFLQINGSENLKELLNILPKMGYLGCNVTVPFKESIFNLLPLKNRKTPIPAVNTIHLFENEWIGYNTDIFGFTQSIQEAFGEKFAQKKTALVLGAGGTSHSIICGLKQMQVSEIFIYNRTYEKAEQISNLYDTKPIRTLGFINLETIDLIINTTTVGLKGEEVELDYNQISSKHFIFDVIYGKNHTKFLQNSKKNGAKICDGSQMLLFQAAKSFEIWTSIKPII